MEKEHAKHKKMLYERKHGEKRHEMFKKEEVLSNQDFVPFDKDAKAEDKAHD